MKNNVVDFKLARELKDIEKVFTPKVYTMSEEEIYKSLVKLVTLFEEVKEGFTCASCGEMAELQRGLCVPCHEHIASISDLCLPVEYFDVNDDPFAGQPMDDTVYYSDDRK